MSRLVNSFKNKISYISKYFKSNKSKESSTLEEEKKDDNKTSQNKVIDIHAISFKYIRYVLWKNNLYIPIHHKYLSKDKIISKAGMDNDTKKKYFFTGFLINHHHNIYQLNCIMKTDENFKQMELNYMLIVKNTGDVYAFLEKHNFKILKIKNKKEYTS